MISNYKHFLKEKNGKLVLIYYMQEIAVMCYD